jgi:putative membrane protein
MMFGYGNGWAFFLMSLVMIVLVAAIVVAVVFAVRGMSMGGPSDRSPSSPTGEHPKDILKRRCAAGEIDREEFLQRLHDLES